MALLMGLTSVAQNKKIITPGQNNAISKAATTKKVDGKKVDGKKQGPNVGSKSQVAKREGVQPSSSANGRYVITDNAARFVVLNAKKNGVDVTAWAIENGVFTVFYNSGEQPCMANVCLGGDSQSWGPIYNLTKEKNVEHDELANHDAEVYKFLWNYTNTYDDKTGTCRVTFKKIYKPQGVVSVLKMVTESLDVTEYTGYMEGTVDLSKIGLTNH